jgi:uncharacterized protein YdeI (YjbR/CyaY-like superfamily)
MSDDRLTVPDVAAWRAWLDAHESTSEGVRLVLAKKGTTTPTSLTYAEALDEALCSGWIDGRRNALDAGTFLQHFTPRRARSIWSMRNVDHVARLVESGRMRPRGRAEIDRAKDDGRWDRAYAGQADMEPPADLAVALADSARASRVFAGLSRSARYSVMHPVLTAPTEEARVGRIARAVARLEAGAEPPDVAPAD